MAIINSLERRRVIPNWRDFKSTIENGELQCQTNKSYKISNADKLLKEKIDDFLNSPTIGVAADLVSSAYILDLQDDPIVDKAIKVISENQNISSLSLKDLSEKIRPSKSTNLTNDDQNLSIVPSDDEYIFLLRKRIAIWKNSLSNQPINPIGWVEISRLYSLLGQKIPSERAMRIALALDPNNRFIIRSAVRFFIHYDMAEEAYFYLRRAESLKFDPWLMSTEIATSCILDRRPKFIKESLSLIESKNFSDFSLTELLSSIGTLEFYEGSLKKSKELFRKSLIAPNDNSLAQIEWISKEDRSFQFETQNIKIKNPQEANAIKSFEESNWNQTLYYTDRWLSDIPYSTRPVLLGSFVAETFLNDNEKAIELCKRGLIANPNDIMLKNNLICSYAISGKINDAVSMLEKLKPEIQDLPEDNKIVLQATMGLVLFRLGEFENGRDLYMKAYQNAKNIKNDYLKCMAILHLAKEEINARTDQIDKTFEIVQKEAANSLDNDVKELFKKVKNNYLKLKE
jgi:tetratricopeptide (TPR) repeat protein